MHESARLAYLQAMGVTNWVPRMALPHAALRLPPEMAEEVVDTPAQVIDPPPVPKPQVKPAQTTEVGQPKGIPVVVPRPEKGRTMSSAVADPSPETVAEATPAAIPVAAFYMQLWLAGPCALLVEMAEPGLESANPAYRLLRDILRAAGLPDTPTLYADFRWPLSRNPQFDRSATAASQALLAFMQGRLEEREVVSIGCFGERTALLVDALPEAAGALVGREEALEQLVPAWFAPGLEVLMSEPEEKARLWKLLRRVMSRWQERP